ncbi:translesion error-prone DNA polymerase V autoproteolytic subunit [Patescibacteria group bacterium]|nr:translesion error-prone DNA polymerase V autoproteolytic subunit [Patescibacteria group bacterium]
MTKHLTVKNIWALEGKNNTSLPLFAATVRAGFPSPADDFVEKKLDLTGYMIKNPAATFLVRVEGDSMTDANIASGDILVVDRSKEAVDDTIVVACIDGEFTVKRIKIKGEKVLLIPENSEYNPIEITEENDAEVWGVVTYIIHKT